MHARVAFGTYNSELTRYTTTCCAHVIISEVALQDLSRDAKR